MRQRFTKRNVGSCVSFDAFDGKRYYGEIFSIRNRVVAVRYNVPSVGSVIANLGRRTIKPLTIRGFT
jgi:hypothetical protein